ncbi:MAG: carotenoid 1,2-hydratase [Paracoccaceae bacterium]|nr:carotenoid 1,2-hydratase [Paracoccaceae bacterium]
MSDDGRRAISVIAFIGTVFSPWYAWSGRGDPANHVCLNVTTAGPGGRFTMTDRGRGALRQAPGAITIGPSRMAWDGRRLVVEVDEWGAPPLVTRVRGRIVLEPAAVTGVELPLTPDGAHIWRPFAPVSRIEVDLGRPGWQWRGHGYLDANFGTRPLEDDFSQWTWGRFAAPDAALCQYDALRRDGASARLGMRFGADGGVEVVDLPAPSPLPRTIWGLPRQVRSDPGSQPSVLRTMLDGPFYNRSVVQARIDGATVEGVHETLDLRRYARTWVKALVATRVPRRRG